MRIGRFTLDTIKKSANIWVGEDDEGRNLFISSRNEFKMKYKDENGKDLTLYPSLGKIKDLYWVLAIIPINKLKSMLGKLAQNDNTKMRQRFYRHIRNAHQNDRKNKTDSF